MMKQDNQEADLPEAFLRGLSTAHISGRAQVVNDTSPVSYNISGKTENSSGDLIFYLDGAHSPESIEACAKWFSSVVKDINQPSAYSFNKIHNMVEVPSNGSVRHEMEKTEQRIKITKQVNL